MRIRTIVMAGVMVASSLCLIPSASFANSIGLSPGKMELTVYRGDVLSKEFAISRSGDSGEVRLSVSQTGSEIIDIDGQNELVFEEGVYAKPFLFSVDATNAEVGDQVGAIVFSIEPPADSVFGNGGSTVVYGIAEKVIVHVAERPDASVTLSANEYSPVLPDLAVRTVSTDAESVTKGHLIHVSWVVSNAGTNPVDEIPTDIVISRRGRLLSDRRIISSTVVPAGGSATQGYDYLLSDGEAGGSYNVSVKVQNAGGVSSGWIFSSKTKKEIQVVLAGLLLAVATALVALARDRHLKRRHR